MVADELGGRPGRSDECVMRAARLPHGKSHLRDGRIPPPNKPKRTTGRAGRALFAFSTGYADARRWHERCGRRLTRSFRPLAGVERRNENTERVQLMPVISKFYGIVIRMLVIRPFVAHFHAIYGNCELIVGVAPLRVIQGDAPSRVRAMVLEWATQHQSELLEAWDRLSAAQSPLPIAPLQ